MTVRVAMSAAPLAIVAAREPPVPTMLNGTRFVSPWTMRTWSNGTPSSVAATCASVVSCPTPGPCCVVNTVSRPSGSRIAFARSPPTSNPSPSKKSGGPGAASM